MLQATQSLWMASAVFAVGAAMQPLLNSVENWLANQRFLHPKPLSTPYRFFLTAGCACMYLLAFFTSESLGQFAFMVASLSLCWITTFFDLKYRLIPNDVLLLLLIVGALGCAFGYTQVSLAQSLLGMLATGALFCIPFAFGGKIGGGDVKLAAIIGFCVGFKGMLIVVVFMGGFILTYILFSKFTTPISMKSSIPMGPFVTAAYLLFLIY